MQRSPWTAGAVIPQAWCWTPEDSMRCRCKPSPLMSAIRKQPFWSRGRMSRMSTTCATLRPQQEIPFCGHATIAAAVALVERSPADELIFHTPAGFVSVATSVREDGELVAEMTSVAPRTAEPEHELVSAALQALRWSADDLDPEYPVLLANAGSEHLVLVTKTRLRLADLDYDFNALAKLMRDHALVTLQLIWPESKKRYHSRNPFAGSGVVEDPATGAAAAAFGGYLRELGKIGETAAFTIIQGVDMGCPSKIEVSVIGGEPGVRVTGAAHRIDG